MPFVFVFVVFIIVSCAECQILSDPTLLEDPFSNVMFRMDQPIQPVVDETARQEFVSQEAKATTTFRNLRAMTSASQAPLLFLLESQKTENMSIKSYWITNQVYCKNLPLSVLQLILSLKSLSLKSIDRELEFPVLPTFDVAPTTAPSAVSIPWGIQAVNAPELWKRGVRGHGCTVGVIDTGVRHTHESVSGNIDLKRCLDPVTGKTTVTDVNGHGTHVTGTICGKNGIGVAPDSTAIVCRGCGTAVCSQSDLTACCQHMACPKDPSGKCMNLPRIVSNSWGGGQNSNAFGDALYTWDILGIFAIFAIGNSGPKCSSANSPGDHPGALGVGSISEIKNCSSFSSRGPTADGRTKPEVSAPGDKVNSADFLTDNTYKVMSGTSMACPHVSGVAALIVSDITNINNDILRQALVNSCNTQNLVTFAQSCDSKPTSTSQFPNNVYGGGFVDALRAHALALQLVAESQNI